MHNSIGVKKIIFWKIELIFLLILLKITFWFCFISQIKQQMFDADWDYFTKLPMITCYDMMFNEPSTSFLTSLLWYKHCSYHKNICRFGNFITVNVLKLRTL